MWLILILALSIFPWTRSEPIAYYQSFDGKPYNVSYDSRAVLMNGQRTVLLSGSIHYPRSTPQMWPEIFSLAVKNGLNTIETYVFWNLHESVRGTYDFSGRANITRFIELAAQSNLFVNVRIGPYICGEWDYGGFPLWLRNIPDVEFRTSNAPYQAEMQKWVTYIVGVITPYLAKNGGPVILAQIENEYDVVNAPADAEYVEWIGNLIGTFDVQLPWIMCNGAYANNTIETCNDCYGDNWISYHLSTQPDKPPMWTENEGWIDLWGRAPLVRLSSDLAYSVARWFAKGGTHHNYYMWHGGNHYGITAAAGLTTSYANDVLLDAMALPNQPKYSHLGQLHLLIANYAGALLSPAAIPTPTILGPAQDLIDFSSIKFISNFNFSTSATVNCGGFTFFLPAESVIITDADFNVIFNTSDVSETKVPHTITPLQSNLNWSHWKDTVGAKINVISNPVPIEQLSITNDTTDYMWYSLRVNLPHSVSGNLTIISVQAQIFSLFVDNQYLSSSFDSTKGCCDHVEFNLPISQEISAGTHAIDIFSGSIGVDNYGDYWGHYMQTFVKGIIGSVTIGDINITETSEAWLMQSGTVGESIKIFDQNASVTWIGGSVLNQPITWYRSTFMWSETPHTVALNLTGMNKGHAFVNGFDIGRYWLLIGPCEGFQFQCTQWGPVCDQPTQSLYHIPPDILKEGENELVLFEEIGATNLNSVVVVLVS